MSSDFLLELSKNPQTRALIKSAGLPIPLPQELKRLRGPREERILDDAEVVVGGHADLASVIARTLVVAGANPTVVGEGDALEPYSEPGEAYGRPATAVAAGEVLENVRPDGMVFDATGLSSPDDLGALYEFFHPWVRRLARCARVVVLARPPESAESAAAAATSAGVEGFVRSLAKEIGRLGATANLVYVERGAEARAAGVLRFFLSPASAFVTGQPVRVTTRVEHDEAGTAVRPLEGKVALVTGAARGIGAATAEILANEGAHVVCLDRPADDGPCSAVARKVGGSVLLADVSASDAPENIARELKEKHGGVDIVIHNAGVTRDKTLGKMKREIWDQALDINLAAVVRINQRLISDDVVRAGGKILHLSSIAGLAGNNGQTNYAASKRGIAGYTEKLAAELQSKGIAVNAVAPGFIETRLTDAIPVMIREAARRMSALGQGGLPEDVGQVLAFLSTRDSDGLTGNVLRVCGGALVGA